jgi:hypothetical protein
MSVVGDCLLTGKSTVSGHAAVSGRARIRSAWRCCPVTARSGGGFAGPEELIAFTELTPDTVDDLRDRLLFLAVE